VVKGIVPETPAPVAAPPAAVVPARTPPVQPQRGLWGRIVAFFAGEPAATATPAVARPLPASPRPAREAEPRGDRRPRHERDRRDGRRDEKRGDRKESHRGERRPDRASADGGRAEREAHPPRDESAAARPAPEREGRKSQERRGDRKGKPVPIEEVTAPLPAASVSVEAGVAAASASLVTPDAVTADAASDERRGKRRRRRRGRGGRGGEGDTATGTEGTAGDFEEDLATEAHTVPESVEEAVVPVAALAPTSGNGSAIMHAESPPAVPVIAVAPGVPPVVPRETVADHPVTAATPQAIVVPTPHSLPVAASAPMPIEQLQSVLELAGLTAGRCATCASRSPTAATSAAATACPRRCSTRTTASCRTPTLLSFEEITRLARLFVAHGVQKLRLTGGEPLLRKNLERADRHAGRAAHPTARPLDLTLTTNGSLLARKARRWPTPACSASRSASTRSTTRCSGA
jgi:hypothetical protein